jgi:hypothetical protein
MPRGSETRADQVEVLMELAAGLEDRAQRGTRQLELAARLERDAGPSFSSATNASLLAHRRPVVLLGDGGEQVLDAGLARVGHGPQVFDADPDLLVLGADPERLARLLARARK